MNMQNKKPHILFMVIDSARLDHMSIYGYDKPTTPFLVSIADELSIYLNANTPAAWTRPAMSSIFTGLYPEQYGFFDEKYIGKDMPILTESLKNHGYRVVLLSNNAFVSPATGFDRGVDDFYYINRRNFYRELDKKVIMKYMIDIIKQYLIKNTSYKTVSWMINDQAESIINNINSSSEPFFVYIHHDAHHPYLSDRKYLKHFIDSTFHEDEIKEVEIIQKSGDMYQFNRESVPSDKKAMYYQILRAMHDTSIYQNDCMIRSLIQRLKSKGLYDNTMIIITADHGEFLGEKDFISHGLYLYEEVVKVPLLIKFPKETGLTGNSDRLVSTIDLFPTIANLAGSAFTQQNPFIQGRSLLSDNIHELVVCQKKVFGEGLEFWMKKYPDHSFQKYDFGNLTCLKTRDNKFIASSKGKHGLYDLKNDPDEQKNIFSELDSLSQLMLKKYQDWIESLPRIQGENKKDFDEQMKEQLRGLGYIE